MVEDSSALRTGSDVGGLDPLKAPGPGVAGEGWYQATSPAKTARIATAPILLASGRLVYSAAGTRSFKISLTAAGKRLLAHAKQLSVSAKEVFAPRGGAPITASVGVVLRR